MNQKKFHILVFFLLAISIKAFSLNRGEARLELKSSPQSEINSLEKILEQGFLKGPPCPLNDMDYYMIHKKIAKLYKLIKKPVEASHHIVQQGAILLQKNMELQALAEKNRNSYTKSLNYKQQISIAQLFEEAGKLLNREDPQQSLELLEKSADLYLSNKHRTKAAALYIKIFKVYAQIGDWQCFFRCLEQASYALVLKSCFTELSMLLEENLPQLFEREDFDFIKFSNFFYSLGEKIGHSQKGCPYFFCSILCEVLNRNYDLASKIREDYFFKHSHKGSYLWRLIKLVKQGDSSAIVIPEKALHKSLELIQRKLILKISPDIKL